MTNTAEMIALAEEYLRFQSLDKEKMDFNDHIRMYESLTRKMEQAGVSYYDLSVYVRARSENKV